MLLPTTLCSQLVRPSFSLSVRKKRRNTSVADVGQAIDKPMRFKGREVKVTVATGSRLKFEREIRGVCLPHHSTKQ